MKWLSTKTHRPSYTCQTCIVRTDGGSLYVADATEYNDGMHWDCHDENIGRLDNVTHFIIPDALELGSEE